MKKFRKFTKLNINKTKTNKLKITVIWIVFILVFIGELFLHTWYRIKCREIGYKLSDEVKENVRLIAHQKKLKVELASLKSPARIAKIAKEDLGLKMPGPEQMVTIP